MIHPFKYPGLTKLSQKDCYRYFLSKMHLQFANHWITRRLWALFHKLSSWHLIEYLLKNMNRKWRIGPLVPNHFNNRKKVIFISSSGYGAFPSYFVASILQTECWCKLLHMKMSWSWFVRNWHCWQNTVLVVMVWQV